MAGRAWPWTFPGRALSAIGGEKFSLLTEPQGLADDAGVMPDQRQDFALTGLVVGKVKAQPACHLRLQVASQAVLRANRLQMKETSDP